MKLAESVEALVLYGVICGRYSPSDDDVEESVGGGVGILTDALPAELLLLSAEEAVTVGGDGEREEDEDGLLSLRRLFCSDSALSLLERAGAGDVLWGRRRNSPCCRSCSSTLGWFKHGLLPWFKLDLDALRLFLEFENVLYTGGLRMKCGPRLRTRTVIAADFLLMRHSSHCTACGLPSHGSAWPWPVSR